MNFFLFLPHFTWSIAVLTSLHCHDAVGIMPYLPQIERERFSSWPMGLGLVIFSIRKKSRISRSDPEFCRSQNSRFSRSKSKFWPPGWFARSDSHVRNFQIFDPDPKFWVSEKIRKSGSSTTKCQIFGPESIGLEPNRQNAPWKKSSKNLHPDGCITHHVRTC